MKYPSDLDFFIYSESISNISFEFVIYFEFIFTWIFLFIHIEPIINSNWKFELINNI